jgi:hypothetical protein
MWLKKDKAGSASGGYEWKTDGAVIEVDDEVGFELLDRPGGEFTEASEPPGQRPSDEAKADRASREVTEGPIGHESPRAVATATASAPAKQPVVDKPTK